ncbi:MAG: hypothetical protein IT204_10060 [Fimbriimonadaceae bacterium]|nr:hypothetical protein [Fimbriimonadaceae bacterium]
MQAALLAEAIPIPEAGLDSHGHERKLVNAVNGVYFLEVSTNEAAPAYNCYCARPPETLRAALEQKAGRALDDLTTS